MHGVGFDEASHVSIGTSSYSDVPELPCNTFQSVARSEFVWDGAEVCTLCALPEYADPACQDAMSGLAREHGLSTHTCLCYVDVASIQGSRGSRLKPPCLSLQLRSRVRSRM
jgi:hypothetical protein